MSSATVGDIVSKVQDAAARVGFVLCPSVIAFPC